jgi:antitoxin FitA
MKALTAMTARLFSGGDTRSKSMATLTIRNLEDDVRDKLRVRAANVGRSMEDEVRSILRAAVSGGSPLAVWQMSRELFSGEDGIELEVSERSSDRAVPEFS